jgi:hypothetical protein
VQRCGSANVHQILFCVGLPNAQPSVLYEFISVLALRDRAAFMLHACSGRLVSVWHHCLLILRYAMNV